MRAGGANEFVGLVHHFLVASSTHRFMALAFVPAKPTPWTTHWLPTLSATTKRFIDGLWNETLFDPA